MRAALVAHHTGRPAKFRCDRDDDMAMTGKRHDFRVEYQAVNLDTLQELSEFATDGVIAASHQ